MARRTVGIPVALWCALAGACAADGKVPESVIVTRQISGPYQAAPVSVELIAPSVVEPARQYRVLYILPVAPGVTSRWGSGIREAEKADLANLHDVFVVAPSFAATPWFADHPSDPALQQESHFIKTVIPWVEEHYPVLPSRAGRLLLGFSKSGYGAVMLLLRHPEHFEGAVAWDAPIDKKRPDQFNMIEVFGTEAHFNPYAIPNLVERRAAMLKGGPPRIFLMPNRDGDHAMSGVHAQLRALEIPHVYEFTEHLEHRWDSGWVPRAAELVLNGR